MPPNTKCPLPLIHSALRGPRLEMIARFDGCLSLGQPRLVSTHTHTHTHKYIAIIIIRRLDTYYLYRDSSEENLKYVNTVIVPSNVTYIMYMISNNTVHT